MAVQKTFIKKEVLCDCIVNDGWKEITFNSSGTPSIQDIKIPQRTGGLNISNHSNRLGAGSFHKIFCFGLKLEETLIVSLISFYHRMFAL